MARIAIVGSRKRLDRHLVEAVVLGLDPSDLVVCGGCRGVYQWAAQAARARGLDVVEHRADMTGARSKGEIAGRYHARNQVVVDDSDRVIAFVEPERKGGTKDTIRRATRAGKPVELR